MAEPEVHLELVSDWWADANCLGLEPDMFHPHMGDHDGLERCKAVCRGCDVQIECLHHALNNGEDAGVWGGMSEDERQRIHRRPLWWRRGRRLNVTPA
jgi:WhiB family redox-sensing transcriptional regulator